MDKTAIKNGFTTEIVTDADVGSGIGSTVGALHEVNAGSETPEVETIPQQPVEDVNPASEIGNGDAGGTTRKIRPDGRPETRGRKPKNPMPAPKLDVPGKVVPGTEQVFQGDKPSGQIDILGAIAEMDKKASQATQDPQAAQAPQTPPEQKKTFNASKAISGAMLLLVIDSIVPSVMLKLAGNFNPRYKNVDVYDLKLDRDEKKELEPLAKEVVTELLGEMSATNAFIISIAFIYGGKIATLDLDDYEPEEEPVKKKPAKGGK